MKIEKIDDDNFVIYDTLILDDILEYSVEELKLLIQMLVVRLRKKYSLDIKGYYHLDVYIKKIMILEFHKIDDYEDEIDLNIIVHTNTPILIGIDDYFLLTNESCSKYYYQEKYYIPIDKVNYENYIEFIQIVYNSEAKEVLERGIKL